MMALTRARIVLAPPELAAWLRRVIAEILTRRRDRDQLVMDVAHMRARMAKEHRGQSPWDIKHRRGGLVDIEFIAQYLQLLHAAENLDILSPNTAEALSRLAAAGLLDRGVADDLVATLRFWRRLQSVVRLTTGGGELDEDKAPEGLRNALVRAGRVADEFDGLKRAMDEAATRALEHLDRKSTRLNSSH